MSPRGGVIKHGHAASLVHPASPTYRSWQGLKRRCESPNDPAYRDYGGRGIKVCERWASFENFLADMGERPQGTTLDRVDVNGNYEPANCRWATHRQQSRNRRLGPTQRLVLQLVEDGAKGAPELAYHWPTLSEGSARETLRALYRRGLVDLHGFKGHHRVFGLTDKGRALLERDSYIPVNDLHDAVIDLLKSGASREHVHREIDRICDANLSSREAAVTCDRCEGFGREIPVTLEEDEAWGLAF